MTDPAGIWHRYPWLRSAIGVITVLGCAWFAWRIGHP